MVSNMNYYAHENRATRPPPLPAARDRPRNLPSKYFAPFDPEELTRRLYIVQAQRMHHEDIRRRRIEAQLRRTNHGPRPRSHVVGRIPEQFSEHRFHMSKSGHKPAEMEGSFQSDRRESSYRHVPQVAASQFSRTTTVDNPGDRTLVHRLSKAAMKYHMEGPNADQAMPAEDIAPNEAAKILRRVQSQREKQYDRNQFQHPHILESAPEVDDNQARPAQRHICDTPFAAKNEEEPRRLSSGSAVQALMSSEIEDDRRMSGVQVANSAAHRVDWTQSDENHNQLKHAKTMPARLRKADSKWNLKGRFGKSQKNSDEFTPEDSLQSSRSPISGFFLRFKR